MCPQILSLMKKKQQTKKKKKNDVLVYFSVLDLYQSHGRSLPNSIVMFRIFTSRLFLVVDFCRFL